MGIPNGYLDFSGITILQFIFYSRKKDLIRKRSFRGNGIEEYAPKLLKVYNQTVFQRFIFNKRQTTYDHSMQVIGVQDGV